MHQFTPSAHERAAKTISAMNSICEHADLIAKLSGMIAGNTDLVVSVRNDMTFDGAQYMDRNIVSTAAEEIEKTGGWVMLFTREISAEDVVERCLDTANIAFKRWAIMQRRSHRPEA